MFQNKPSRPGLLIAVLIALSLLSLLSPWPRPRAVSETPWLVEFATTLVLAGVFAYSAFGDREFVGRLFAVGDPTAKRIVRCLALFTLLSLLSTAWARVPYLSVHHAVLWGEYILFFLFVRERLSSGHGMRLIAGIFAIAAGFIGILCLFEYATLPDFTALEGVIRARYGSYSELLVTVLPLLWAVAAYSRRTSNYLLLQTAAALGWITVMLSLSKGAFLAGIAGFVVMFAGTLFFTSGKLRRRAVWSLAVWLVLTVGVQAGFSILSPVPATVDYISGKADATRGTALARVFVWKIGARMAANHPVLGVGADNFGVSFNEARADYRKDHPVSPPDEPVSDYLIERGHNELVQVTAELGIVGLVLFICPFAIFGWAFLKRLGSGRRALRPVFWAALGGMAAFAGSSMVSSFSFRLAQNGIAFFIVFAVAVNELTRSQNRRPRETRTSGWLQVVLAIFFLLSLITLGTKGYAERLVLDGGREPDKQKALELYGRAHAFDPGYASAYLRRSALYYSDADFGPAASELRKAIDGGCGVVLTYSALAASYEKAGNLAAAEQTLNEALGIYPRSVFLRVRYAVFLENAGRDDDSRSQMASARDADKRQADGWYNLFKIGSVRAFYAAREDPELAPPAELLPEAAVLEYLDKPLGEPAR